MEKRNIQPLSKPLSAPQIQITNVHAFIEYNHQWSPVWQAPSANPISFKKAQTIKLIPDGIDIRIMQPQTFGSHIMHTTTEWDLSSIPDIDPSRDQSYRVRYPSSLGPFNKTNNLDVPFGTKNKGCNRLLTTRLNIEYILNTDWLRNTGDNTWGLGYALISQLGLQNQTARSIMRREFWIDKNIGDPTPDNADGYGGFESVPGESSATAEHGIWTPERDNIFPLNTPGMYNLFTLIPRFYQGFLQMTREPPTSFNPPGYQQSQSTSVGIFNLSCADLFSFGSVYSFYSFDDSAQRTLLVVPSKTSSVGGFVIFQSDIGRTNFLGHYLQGSSGYLSNGGRIPFITNDNQQPLRYFSPAKTLEINKNIGISNDVNLPYTDDDSPRALFSLSAGVYEKVSSNTYDNIFVFEAGKDLVESYINNNDLITGSPKLIQSYYETQSQYKD